jgi:hypothetical protein
LASGTLSGDLQFVSNRYPTLLVTEGQNLLGRVFGRFVSELSSHWRSIRKLGQSFVGRSQAFASTQPRKKLMAELSAKFFMAMPANKSLQLRQH